VILTAETNGASAPRPRHLPVPPTLADCRFLGWLKTEADPWKAVAGSDDYDGCWAKLLDVTGGRQNERMVLRSAWRP
jgi:hypothetical protein